ncbi:MAG: 16S rRNA (cytosine(967)-C(5))-methyltransferase RsmB [Longimicrobiales bacterium]
MTPARLAAFRTMRAIRGGVLADHALDRYARELPARERAWAQELVFGTLRLRGRIDHILLQLSHREMEPDVHDVLRLGVYQVREMDAVPAYAAVSESVELAKVVQRRAAGFVNGILQRLIRESDSIAFPRFEDDSLEWLATWGSHPEWLVRRWLEQFGAEGTRRLVEANNERPPLYVNVLGDEAGVRERLDEKGIRHEAVSGVPDAIRVLSHTAAEVIGTARVIVQDPAASLVADYLSAAAGAMVADLCAAPGGKTAVLATARPAPAYVLAGDSSVVRMGRVAQTLERLGGLPVGMVVADARRSPVRMADAVLLDAPCTGTGTLRRHPDARWRLHRRDLESLTALQKEMLEAAAGIVRPGGLLVYATCSIEPEENERQVMDFVTRHPVFRTEAPVRFNARFVDANGWLRVLPHEHGFDGAFAARLRRN